MTKKQFTTFASLAAALGVVVALLAVPMVRSHFISPPGLQASWAETFDNLGRMTFSSDAVVLATVAGSRPGRVVDTAGGQLPFTLVDLSVTRAIRGDVGGLITVEQTGGDTLENAIYIHGAGGAYLPNQQVILFLKKQPETDYYCLINPQGRFSVEEGRLVAVTPEDPVAQVLNMKGVNEALGLIRGELQREEQFQLQGRAVPGSSTEPGFRLPAAAPNSPTLPQF